MKLLNGLEKLLKLEYTHQFNTRKAIAIIAAVVCLNLGIFFVTRSSQFYYIIGSACITLFVRIVMGSIVIEVLTAESQARMDSWLNGEDNSEDSST